MTEAQKQLVADRWSEHTSDSPALSDAVYWLAVPQVMRRHQAKLTDGRFGNWVEAVTHDFFSERTPVGRALSLGCGDGSLERDLASLNFFRQCDAFDLSPVAIEMAAQQATAVGCGDRIHYEIRDINAIELEADCYDAIWFNGSLHHISALERVLDQCSAALKSDGYLVVNEYVGANRFDFPPQQKRAISAAWGLIPDRFRRSFVEANRGEVLYAPPLPDPREVEAVDPSEAVRSAEIASQLRERFRICYERKAGGSILQFLLSGIAGNFSSDDPASMRLLEMLFDIEDSLIEVGELDSDFMLFVAQRL